MIAKAKAAKRPNHSTVSAGLFVRRSDGFDEGPGPHLWQIVPSGLEGNLRTHRECVELGAGIHGIGRADLFSDVAVQVVEHETYVSIDVPVQARSVDRLLSTGHAVCGPQLIVQIHGADAAGNFPPPQPPLHIENGFAGMMPP
jgi:hypothetical protein